MQDSDDDPHVSRHITTLSLDDRECSQGATTKVVVHLRCTLEQAGMKVEDVTRVRLTTRRTTEEQRHLTVRDGLLGQVIKDDEGVLAIVTEPLSHGGTREGGEVLQRSSLGGSGGDDDRVLHGIVLLERLDELGDGGALLTYRDVDAVELLGLVIAIVPAPLVEDGVNGDSGLAGLTVTDDELTLATTNGHHRVDGLETGQHGLVDRAAGENTGSLNGGTAAFRRLDRTLTVDGIAEGVDNTTQEGGADGDVDNLAGTLDCVAFLDETIATEDRDTDIVGFQVEAHASYTR